MPARLIEAPADEPVTLAEAKAHLRVSGSDEDALIMGLIAAARAAIEEETQRALITQTWELTLDYFERPDYRLQMPVYCARPTVIHIPRPPLQSVSWVTYLDGDGNTVYLYDSVGSPDDTSALVVDTRSTPGRIVPVSGGSWPSPFDQANAVTIRYIAGYGDDGEAVPWPLKQAMLLLIGHFYEHREAVIAGQSAELPMGVQFLLNPHRVLAGSFA